MDQPISISQEQLSKKLRKEYWKGALKTAALMGAVGGSIWMYLDAQRADVREQRALVIDERTKNVEKILGEEKERSERLAGEVKSLTAQTAVLQEKLSATLDPERQCGLLLEVVKQKQVALAAQEARVPDDAPTDSPVQIVSDGKIVPELAKYENYEAAMRSVRSYRSELHKAEEDLNACLSRIATRRS
ncbi:hypothetical protein ABIE09_001474 [Lysobacter enzymogenes]|uniref:hypothetical protein n=1 Tax=Lysobacter enzymogenes TaxID=69 RepID=UPI003396E533